MSFKGHLTVAAIFKRLLVDLAIIANFSMIPWTWIAILTITGSKISASEKWYGEIWGLYFLAIEFGNGVILLSPSRRAHPRLFSLFALLSLSFLVVAFREWQVTQVDLQISWPNPLVCGCVIVFLSTIAGFWCKLRQNGYLTEVYECY